MIKSDLFITEIESTIFLTNSNICCENEDGIKKQMPLEQISTVIFPQGSKVTGSLLQELNKKHIPAVFLDWKGHCQGRIEPFISKNSLLRRKQVEFALDHKNQENLAKIFVTAKIKNSRTWLMRHARNIDFDKENHLSSAINELKKIEFKLSSAEDLATIRGYEGLAAKEYFNCFPLLLSNTSFQWNGRSRRPPKDEVNCLLSLGYSLLLSDTLSACHIVGLDPYIGFLHEERAGRPECALDLMEEFRCAYVDAFIFSLIHKKVITENDFIINSKTPILEYQLKPDALKEFLLKWKEYKQREIQHPFLKSSHHWGHFPLLQARLLARFFQGTIDNYPAFLWR
ncbi:CRISPR-associated endonuclease Cas1 [Pigmentibacter sp. JX0631]|uniref:CRISPR-associated endonuclease Cas1 n=1 Tax=Pigmentibacter sp. JX0631 TaxID=2976982 RepID=UPI0024694C9F|nr:CRISPR-associated endonuclease Cas1 [Pigmentibacter sp. JX0631]WGL60034.1 CRISPR-associated endonuclease Cas1 [Pigmentibacter sp. JX0631]